MRYDCALIQDVVSLYHEEVLRARSREIVTEHLAACPACKAYYSTFSAAAPKTDPDRLEAGSLSGFASKIKEYHFYQIGVFVFAVISMLTAVLPWFGHQGRHGGERNAIIQPSCRYPWLCAVSVCDLVSF